MINRKYDIKSELDDKKVLILYGARRVGKTTLLKNFLNNTSLKYKLDSGDNIRTREVLSSEDFSQILSYAEGYELIAIDEAQQIPNIGMGLKILADQIEGLKIIATGSSSFELSRQVGEPLTGRKKVLKLYPFSQEELLNIYNKFEIKENLSDFLIFGNYPEIILAETKQKKIELLNELVDSYILKDILALEMVKGPKVLLELLKLLAFQIGSQVSLNEIACQINLDVKTVKRYLDLLEKSFVIVSLSGLSKNLRKEVNKKNKYYFLDNGIRNAVIAQFNDLSLRNDIGALWENFLFTERLKKNTYNKFYGNIYYWRTYNKKEIDYIEEFDSIFNAYEYKWQNKKKIMAPSEWTDNYKNSTFNVINQENYLDFVL